MKVINKNIYNGDWKKKTLFQWYHFIASTSEYLDSLGVFILNPKGHHCELPFHSILLGLTFNLTTNFQFFMFLGQHFTPSSHLPL